jgi:subtilisin family serine protease/spore germination cell wall hydrolase CwlJ-like protein
VIVRENGRTFLRRGPASSTVKISHHPSRLIVRFRPGKAAALLPGSPGARALAHQPGLFLVQVPPGMTVEEAAGRYAKRPDVLYAEPDSIVSANTDPNDPRWSEQWDMVKIAAPAAWISQTNSSDVVVAVVDTGITFTHPDLQGNLWTDLLSGAHGFSCLNGTVAPGGQDDYGHGTHVAGTIGAAGNNGLGIAGLNWSVQLLSLKFLDANGNGYTSDAIACFGKMVELRQNGVNVRVSNNSWSGGVYSQALKDAMASAENAGILHVCAAGNSTRDLDVSPEYPAAFDNRGILTVTATDSADAPASFSNSGFASADLAAPGVSTLSTVPSGTCPLCDATGYKLLSGTSMAAPHVTGVAAALFHLNPSLTPAQARDILLDPASVDPLTSTSVWADSTTHGRLNYSKAINNPLVAAPRLNGFPQMHVPSLVTHATGETVPLQAVTSDPDGDPLQVQWAKPLKSFLIGAVMNQVFFPGWFYPPTVSFNPVTFTAPSLARTAVAEYDAFAHDGRGGSASGTTWVTIPANAAAGQPPTGALTVTPASGPSGTVVTVGYSGSDPEGGSLLYGFTGPYGLCCYDASRTFQYTLGTGVYRFSGQSVDPELNLSSWSSVVVRIGGATGEPPIADLVLSTASGPAPLTVSYDATGSTDPDGGTLTFYPECEAWSVSGFLVAAPPTGSCTFDTPGIHTVGVMVSDNNGYHDERIAYVMVTPPVPPPDTTAPTVMITAPSSGASLSGTVAVNVTAYDDLTDLAKVEVYSDAGVLLGTDTVPPYSVSWNTSAAAYGAHTLYAMAYDQAGNASTSATVQVNVVDVVPPSVSITAPSYNQSVTGPAVAITASATDAGGVTRVDFFGDGALLGTATTTPYGITWDTTTVVPGAHNLTAKAYDQAGNAGTSFTVRVSVYDSTPPVVSLTAPAAGASLSGTVTLSATASDLSGLSIVYFYSDAGYLGSASTAPYTFNWNTATASPGPHTLYARAYDTYGNPANSPLVAVTVLDGVPPAVSLTAPAAGASVSGSVTISASASDNAGVTRVEFFSDGNLVAADTTAPFSIIWDSTAVTPGTHSLTAKAYDAAGNTTTSAAVSVTVLDGTPPTVSLTAPAAGVSISGTVEVNASADDNVGVTRVDFFKDGSFIAADTTAPFGIIWDSAAVTPGTHSLTAKAYDAAGNTTTSAAVSVTVLDVTPPTVSLTAPAAGASVSGSVTISASASDNAGVTRVDFFSDGNLAAADTTAPFAITWDSTTVTPGPHSLTAKAYDAAGNTSTSAAVSVTVFDVTPPTVAITAPAAGASVSGSVAISASASDNAGVTRVDFFFDGTPIASDFTVPYAITWYSAAVAPGAHSLTAMAYDAAGNSATSAAVSVTVLDVTPPTIALTAPAAGTVSGSVAVNASASDNVGVTRVDFFFDGNILIASDTAAPFGTTWDSTAVTPGSHFLTAKAYDAAGNAATSAAVSVTVLDVTPPTVAITAPAAGASVSGSVAISAAASDNAGVTRVDFFSDGSLIAADTTAPFAVTWDSTAVAPGAHSLTAKAYDAAGNATTSAAVSVTVLDVTPPTVAITSPANGATVPRNATTTITATASDNVGVTKVEFYVGTTLKCTDTTSPYACAWSVPKTVGAQYSLQAKAYDARGNVAASAVVNVTAH